MSKFTLSFKGFVFALSVVCLPSLLNAQYFWDFGVNVGASNYLGDIGGKDLTRRDFVADMRLQKTQMTAGAFARYKITRLFSVQGNLAWVRIAGDDKLSTNPARNARNLNFRNDLVELSAQAQFFFYEVNDLGHTYRNKDNFRAYVGLGAGAIYHSPKTSYNGEMVALRPLMTEANPYTKVTAVIPASMGFYFTLNKNYRIGWNLTWRTTFSDYLDDVSTTYADPSQLPSAIAIELANRTDELTSTPSAFAENFTPGNKRGDVTHNDSYLSTSVDMSYVIRGRSSIEKSRYSWIQDRHNHPNKYDGPDHRRKHGPIRKIRLHW